MRHRRRGRKFGRTSSHRRAMLRNLASSLLLTERDDLYYDGLTQPDGRKVNPPKQKGRVTTTLQKAKEVRSLVEKCVTIARNSIEHEEAADEFSTDAERNSDAWKEWRKSDKWQSWNQAISPVVAARRRCLQLLGDKEAVQILFDEIAPRFRDRDGGYTRVLRLATPRLGDAGEQAIIEFVGIHDRVAEKAEKPAFDDEVEDEEETAKAEDSAEDENSDAESADEQAESTDTEAESENKDE